ncbi:MAG: NAD(P)H-binding protein [Rhodobacteraceae bacterium]|nr:NAD(P)H-binding protein [Paracoccaceae bacterium]
MGIIYAWLWCFAAQLTDSAVTGEKNQKRVLLLGATGTAGRAVGAVLPAAGYGVVSFGRSAPDMPNMEVRTGDLSTPASVYYDGIRGEVFDAVVSCLASRTGAAAQAWDIDYAANLNVLHVAAGAGVRQFVYISAICVQKPRLAFQRAKLAMEEALISSGMVYSIVRPTAFFKSLSGQVARVREGKPFMVFGNGRLTACKPISDRDLAAYVVRCLTDKSLQNRILPIGGPGPAITPVDQAEILGRLLGREVPLCRVPAGILSVITGGLSVAGLLSFKAREKADLARVGHYYGTESMLLWNGECYDADATPEFGSDTLEEHYRRILAGEADADLGTHAVF